MDPNYLARNDGRVESAGRGSGLHDDENTRKREAKETPYMHMTFAPLERRLDTAIFRALFASSTRQARQFVVHGAVKVNGKKVCFHRMELLATAIRTDICIDEISRLSA